MTIDKERNGNTLKIALEGRLDSSNASELEQVLTEELPGSEELIFDLKDLRYMSSAGLRLFLISRKKVGLIRVRNANETIREIFEMTGISTIVTMEEHSDE